jgi:hypothetical protein
MKQFTDGVVAVITLFLRDKETLKRAVDSMQNWTASRADIPCPCGPFGLTSLFFFISKIHSAVDPFFDLIKFILTRK